MYSSIHRVKNGRDALAYCEQHDAHFGGGERNILIGYYNLLSRELVPIAEQMQRVWDRGDNPAHVNQIDMILISASKHEFDPEDPADQQKFLDMCMRVLEKMDEDMQAAVFVQKDGKSGHLHAHITVNDYRISDAKRIRHELTSARYLEKLVDDTALEYIPRLDLGGGFEREPVFFDHLNEQGKYIWKDDLKRRIRLAVTQCEDESELDAKLAENGISYHARGGGVTYELTDLSLVEQYDIKQPAHGFKAKDKKLGDSYKIENMIEEIRIRLGKTAPDDEIIEPVTDNETDIAIAAVPDASVVIQQEIAETEKEVAEEPIVEETTQYEIGLVEPVVENTAVKAVEPEPTVEKPKPKPRKDRPREIIDAEKAALDRAYTALKNDYEHTMPQYYDEAPTFGEILIWKRAENKRRKANGEELLEPHFGKYDPVQDVTPHYSDVLIGQAIEYCDALMAEPDEISDEVPEEVYDEISEMLDETEPDKGNEIEF